MALLIAFTDNRMNDYIWPFKAPINRVVQRHLDHLSEFEKGEKNDLFQLWIKAQDKLSVAHCYADSGWRALYARILYESRILTVQHTFEQLVRVRPDVLGQLAAVRSVVSIGCGPGPEIAALLIALRVNLGSRRPVTVLGLDQYGEWNEFVLSLNSVQLCGCSSRVEFQKLRVDEDSLRSVREADLCLMSYTDAAVHTQRFWRELRAKFPLIIILDQRQPHLANVLRQEQFSMIEYEFKDKKRFFYWIKGAQQNGVCYPSNSSDDLSDILMTQYYFRDQLTVERIADYRRDFNSTTSTNGSNTANLSSYRPTAANNCYRPAATAGYVSTAATTNSYQPTAIADSYRPTTSTRSSSRLTATTYKDYQAVAASTNSYTRGPASKPSRTTCSYSGTEVPQRVTNVHSYQRIATATQSARPERSRPSSDGTRLRSYTVTDEDGDGEKSCCFPFFWLCRRR